MRQNERGGEGQRHTRKNERQEKRERVCGGGGGGGGGGGQNECVRQNEREGGEGERHRE